MNYKNTNDLFERKSFSKKILSKNMGLIPIVIESSDYDIAIYIGSRNKMWICKEYYEKTELQYILLDILKNVFINNISLESNQQIEFKIGSYKFPLTTKLEEIYYIYKDPLDDILYLNLVRTNIWWFTKMINYIKSLEYDLYKFKQRIFKKNEKYESPYTEIV